MSRSRTSQASEAAVLMAEAFSMAARSAVARAVAAGVAPVGENPKRAKVEARATEVKKPRPVPVVKAVKTPAIAQPAAKAVSAPKAPVKKALPVKPAAKKAPLPKAAPKVASKAAKHAPKRAPAAKLVRK